MVSTQTERDQQKMTIDKFNANLEVIEADLRQLWESALEARNAANDVLNQKQALEIKIVQMRNEALQAEIAAQDERE